MNHPLRSFLLEPPRRIRRLGAVAVMAAGGAVAAGLLLNLAALGQPLATRAAPAAQAAPTAVVSPLPERYIFSGAWGSPDQRQGLDHPGGMALADDGRVFVAEQGGDRISVWSISGRAIASWASSTDRARFSAPVDVAFEQQRNRLYVAEPSLGRVQVLHADNGEPLASYDNLGRPTGLAVGRDGHLFVADDESDRIRVLDADGQAIDSWGATEGEGRLRSPGGLAWHAGRLYVADRDNLRIVVFDEMGQLLPDAGVDMATGEQGGRPLDVDLSLGRLYIATEHALLRTRPGGGELQVMPPLEEYLPPDCARCELCRELRPVVANHEGVRGVAALDGVGLAFSYAPDLRAGDRIVVHPERGFPDVFPSWVCAPPAARQLFDPYRIDAGESPELAHVLDRSGQGRILDERGGFFDATRPRPVRPGADIAADGNTPYHTAVLTDNLMLVDSLRCFLGCPPAEVGAADARSLQTRNRVGELVPDYRWWHRAMAFRGPLAVLDAGRARIVLREGFPCGAIDVPFCTDRNCRRSQECPVNPTERPLLGGESLVAPRDPFRAFSDLAYDPAGALWALARDGTVLGLDRFGRDAGAVALAGLGERSAEALAVDSTGFYVLGSDSRVSKHGRDGALRAVWHPQDDVGTGRFEDLTVAPDGRVLLVDGAGQQVLVYSPSFELLPPPAEPARPGCRPVLSKRAGPDPVALGDPIEIELGLTTECPPRDIVIAVDGSCQMAGSRLAAAREAARALVATLDPDRDRLALAVFGDEPGAWQAVATLTSDLSSLDAAAAALPSLCRPVQLFPERRNDGRIAEGLRAGRHLLFGPDSRAEARKVLVLAAASTIDRQHVEAAEGRRIAGQRLPKLPDREHALFEARQLWRAGVRIHSFGLGLPDRPLGPPPQPTPDLQSSQPPDEGILAALAQPPEAYGLADPPTDLPALWTTMAAAWRAADAIDDVEVSDALPDDMRLVPSSARPPAAAMPDGLRWSVGRIAAGESITLSLSVTPTQSGLRATNREAVAIWRAGEAPLERALFPVPVVRVIAPTPPATASPTATASPSATLEPTAGPTREATPTPAASATDRPPLPTAASGPRRLFLPAALQHRCKPVAVALDVVLLLDSSSSMQGAKIDAAREAAGIFLTLLELGRDRVALVRFDRSDEVLVPLTADGDAVRRALAEMRTDVGTRIDLGLIGASDLLSAHRRPRTDQVIVLLTDGRPELGSEEEAIRVAAATRAADVDIWAVGLGREVPVSLLDAITGDPTRVRLAPDAGTLVAIYESIARLLPCR